MALHGFGPDLRLMRGMLEPVFECVEPDYRRLYVDLPGCGQSSAAGVNSTSDVVQAVDELIAEEVGDDTFLIVGESYGGYLAREIVRRRRTQVAGMALVCPVAEPRQERRHLPDHEVVIRDEVAVASMPAEDRESFEPLAVIQTAATIERFRADIAPGLRAADRDALSRIEAGGYTLPQAPEEARTYNAPCLILAARQDSVVGFLDQWSLLPSYPRATFAVLDAAGHNAQIERPDLVSALIRDWLARVAEPVQSGG